MRWCYLSVVLAVCALHLRDADGHEVFWGSCPTVTPMEDFDMDRMEGLWYVAELFESKVRCMTWNFTRGEEEGTYHVLEEKASGRLNSIGLTQPSINTATLRPHPSNHSARWLASWPLNLVGAQDFTIFMTDYDSYAGIFECQKVTFFHRQQPLILSRQPIMPVNRRQEVGGRLASFGIEVAYLKRVDHGICVSATEGLDLPGPGPLGTRQDEEKPEDQDLAWVTRY
ncbi:apolipoprotein D-like [Oratosquilla oratoria]|uniref:apolipoprotein D-like n=1 Tax=Oratosquilla oratoria TaxID=337810 RepID=UPI003F76D0EE